MLRRWRAWLIAAAIIVLAAYLYRASGRVAALVRYYGETKYEPYRWRLTVVVSTPRGRKSFSGVFENQDSVTGPGWPVNPGSRTVCVAGDAIPMDLGDGVTIYVLPWRSLNWDWARYAPQAYLPPGTRDNYELATAMQAARGAADLPREGRFEVGWPSFLKVGAPLTRDLLPLVDPDKLAPGMRVVRVSAASTRDPVSRPLGPSLRAIIDSLPPGADTAAGHYLSQPTSFSHCRSGS